MFSASFPLHFPGIVFPAIDEPSRKSGVRTASDRGVSPESAFDEQQEEDGVEDDDDDDYVSDSNQNPQSRAHRNRKSSSSKRSRPGEGVSRRTSGSKLRIEEKEDQASADDQESSDSEPERKRPRPAKKTSATNAAGTVEDDGPLRDAPADDKTRTHCRNQLKSIFKSIFAGTEVDKSSEGVEVRASSFSENVEQELFEGHAEVEKNVRGPRTKYLNKFRSLHFNLRTNAAFRSRISSSELTPKQIVNMSADDLMTPELKAMADSVRAASLKHSVKEALAAPTAKRTHKGEEAIENIDIAAQAAQEELALAKKAERDARDAMVTDETQETSTPHSPTPRDSASTEPNSARTGHRVSLSGTTAFDITAEDIGLDLDDELREANTSMQSDRRTSIVEDIDMPPAERPRQRASFDMSSILSKIKAPTKSTTPEADPPASDPTAGGQDEEDDFGGKASRVDEDFEEALLRGEDAVKRRNSGIRTVSLDERPTVWSGDVLVTDQGGFPANVKQLGGRYVGLEPETWKRMLPKSMSTDGRIPTATAVKYLIECAISPTRELFVLAALPDLSGPTDSSPYKPSAEKCLGKYQHILDFYTKKDRIGVVAPKGELKQVVKDIYLMPLRTDDFLPEYVDLLDEHEVPAKGSRDRDLILVVIVAQKNLVPTARRPSPKPTAAAAAVKINTETTSVSEPTVPASTTVAAFDPSMLAKIDQSALNSLLSNPALLQSALATAPTQSPPASAHAAYGAGAPTAVPHHSGGGNSPATTYSSYGAANPRPTAASWMSPQGSVTAGGYTPPTASLSGHGQSYDYGHGNSRAGGNRTPLYNSGHIEPPSPRQQAGGGAQIHPSRLAMMQGDRRDEGYGRGGVGRNGGGRGRGRDGRGGR
ncbi:Transcription factor bye1 [Microbotryomycetes sp. JL221]|nr:Transcription factor bye1 [Microbotryomycetes sp. JL221]